MLRKIIFWSHLAAGLIAGFAIGVMCFTGTLLAFEKPLVAWAERDARRVEPPAAHAPRLSLGEMQRTLREAQPDARPTTIVWPNDPHAAVAFSAGGHGGGGSSFYVNPYTGEVRQPRSTAMSRFMQAVTAWHRTLNFTGEQTRPHGKLINGACNLAFCGLALSGLYLWFPRQWSWRAVRPIVWFRRSAGKARDFNWHNVIGLWSAPVLIVLTLTAIPMSFQWGSRTIATFTGTPANTAPGGEGGRGGSGGGLGGPPVEVPTPAAGAKRLTPDELLATVQKETPHWETITLRAAGGRGAEAQAATFTVRTGESWPRTATIALALDPFTGAVLRRTGPADLPAAQRVRGWTRFLHTGEALGPLGQLVAGLACLGGCVLVYTGFALAWRRFFSRRIADPAR